MNRITLVLSPHLDDAVLSVGAAIATRVAAGEQVLVATLMTGDEPPMPPSPAARTLYRVWHAEMAEGARGDQPLPSAGLMARRRSEDLVAVARLGAQARHLGLADALFRVDSDGAALYPHLRDLFRAPVAADRSIRQQLTAAVTDLLREIAASSSPVRCEIWGPLAIGGHVDHRLVASALAAWQSSGREADGMRSTAAGEVGVRFYEDVPYNLSWRGRLDRWRRLRPRRRWRCQQLAASPAAATAKIEALLAYPSQVGPLFGSPAALRLRILAALGNPGERLWEPT